MSLGQEALHLERNLGIRVDADVRGGQLDQPGVRDALGHVGAAVQPLRVAEDERGHRDRRKHLADVGLHQHPHEPGGGAGAGGEPLVVHVPLLEGVVVRIARKEPAHLLALVLAAAPVETRLAHLPAPLLHRLPGREVRRRGHARPGVLEDERDHALRIGGREHGRKLTPRRAGAEQGGALRAGVVHHRTEVVHTCLERGQVAGSVREAGPALVEQDQARERREPVAEVNEDRLFPGPDQVDQEGHEQHVHGPVTDHLVRDAHVPAAGVADLGCVEVHGGKSMRPRGSSSVRRLLAHRPRRLRPRARAPRPAAGAMRTPRPLPARQARSG